MKRLIRLPGHSPQSRQLVLRFDLSPVRRWNIFLYDGSRMILAATVALLIGLVVDRPLLIILLPIATSLYTYGVLRVARERRKGVPVPSLFGVSMRSGLDVWRRPRLPKYSQKSLDL